jgi:hypothetical protein
MKSPEYIVHGTTSKKDAEGIEKAGFKAEEGRATVSASLIYALEWAMEDQKRGGSKSKTELANGETGRIIVMRTPYDTHIDYATHTNVHIDGEAKELSGYITKYVSGRKQLGIYSGSENETVTKREKIESVKKEILQTKTELVNFLAQHGIEHEALESWEDLVEAVGQREVEEPVAILKQAEYLNNKIQSLRPGAETPIVFKKKDILMSLVPSVALTSALISLRTDIYALKSVDIEKWTEEITKVILLDEENSVTEEVDVKEVIQELLRTTIKTEAVNVVRSLALYVKRAQSFVMKDRSGVEVLDEFPYTKEAVREMIEKSVATVTDEKFSTGVASVDRYLRKEFSGLLQELN